MAQKTWQRVFSTLLLVGMFFSWVAPAAAAPIQPVEKPAAPLTSEEALAKIESLVLTELETAGQTDFFVWMTEKADLSPAAKLATKEAKGQFVFDALRATAERTQQELRKTLTEQGFEFRPYYIANKVFVFGGNRELALALASRSDVSKITANHQYQLQEPFIDSDAPESPAAVETNISFVNADDVWGLGVTGAGTVMAGNDTGLDWDHPALINQYRGWDGSTADHNYNWWDATGSYPTVPGDGHGHGTHTSGTMVGDDGVGNQIGMAPGAQLVHCKNMTDGGSGDDTTFSTCFEWDLAPWDLSGLNPMPSMAPDAINNSWGYWGGGAPQFEDEIAALQAAGILVEVSAGNEGSSCSTLRSPSDYASVLTTGSIQHSGGVMPGTITGFSSRGPSSLYPGDFIPDVMAPGENIRSSVPGGGFEGGWSGTSMSGPHVTALIGLMWSANPAMRGQIAPTVQIIIDTAVPLTGQGGSGCGGDYTVGPNNDWGYGTIDALAAVQMAIAMGGAGQLDGTVTDATSSLPVEDVEVTALHEDGFSWTVLTDASGYYTMTVAAGTFTVSTEHPGYQPESVSGLVVVTDTLTTQDFSLTPRGMLEGYVTDFDNGFGLDAMVQADDGTTAYTDPDTGYYMMYLDPGIYDVTASADNYAPETASVSISTGATTAQDFELEAAVAFTPAPIEATLTLGDEGIPVTGTITNRLPTPYDFEFQEKATGFTPALVSLPPFEGTLPVDTRPASIERAPNAGQASAAEINQFLSQVLAGEPAYAVDIYPGYNLVNIPDTTLPGNWNVIAGLPGNQYFGGDFLNGDFSTLYAVDYGYNQLHAVDTATGAVTVIGSSVPSGGESWTGLTGSADGILYGAATTCSNSTLYEVDPSTGAVTTIGAISNGPCIIDIAINADGDLYGVDIVGDVLVQIDPATGAGTVIGSLGASANYAQGMDFEDETGILYWAAYTASGELRVIDPATGNSTLIGAFPGGAEVDSFAFATGGAGGGLPWLGEDPISGTVPADSTLPVTVYFTATEAAGITQPGDYTANLKLRGTPSLDIPVVMTVEPPATWAMLDGTITGLGYCDVNPVALEEAEIYIEGAGGYTGTVMTDENGYFQWWLDEMYSPLDVTVTFPGYETGFATGVVIAAPGTTTVDFDLRWLQPCGGATPDGLETTLDFGQTDTQQITIFNSGAADLHFEMGERDKGYEGGLVSLPPFEGTLPVDTRPASIERAPNAGQASAAEINQFLNQVLAGEPAYAIDIYPGYNLVNIPDTTLPGAWNVIANLPGSQYFGGDFLNGDFSTLYAVEYAYNELHAIDTATGAVTVIGSSVPSAGESWTGLTGSVDGVLYGAATTCSNSTLYEVDPGSGAVTAIGEITNGPCIIDIAINADGEMYGVDIAGDVLVQIDPATGAGVVIGSLGASANYAQGMDFEDETGILYWAAYTASGELRVIDPATGNSTLIGAFPGGAEVDAFGFATGGGGDVPWLSESPITGTVPSSPLTGEATILQAPDKVAADARVAPEKSGFSAPTYAANPEATLLDEGFESGVFPPVGWTQVITNSSYTWDDAVGYAYNGVYGAYVPYDYDQDEWLLSPAMDLAVGTLSFWSVGSIYWCRDTFDNCDLNVWIVVGDVGGGDDIYVGNADAGWPASWVWTQSTFDLTPFLPGGPVRIGFQYLGDDGADIGLDDVMLSAPSSQAVDVTFDANMVGQPGVYTADLIVKSDDPVNDRIAIPVTMTITAPPDWGQLEGTVTGLGYCDVNPAALEEAEIYIEGDGGALNWTLYTDEFGFYSYWFDEAYSPMTMTVTYPDHSVGTAIVTVTGGNTTVQDFDLYWLVPCVSTDAVSFEATLDMGERYTTTLDLYNDGAGVADFEFSDRETSYTPALLGGQMLTIPASPAVAPAGTAVAAGAGYKAREARSVWAPAAPADGENVLIACADDNNCEPLVTQLLAFGNVGSITTYDVRGLTPTLDELTSYDVVVVWSNYLFADPVGLGDVLADYVDDGGRVINMMFALDPSWGMQGRFMDEDYTAMKGTGTLYINACLGAYDPGHPIMAGITDACDVYRNGGTYLTPDSTDVADWDDGQIFVAAKDNMPVVSINAYPGIAYMWTGQVDAVVNNAILYLNSGGEALWLDEFPLTGTVDPYDLTTADIVFDAGKVAQPGQYTADLKVATNDPLLGKITIPVTMTVAAPDDYGRLQGVVNSLGHCDVNPALAAGAMVYVENNTGITWTIETNDAGAYLIWLDQDGSPYTVYAAADDHEDSALVQVDITGGGDTFQDFDLRWLAPCISVDPGEFNVEVGEGYQLLTSLSLINAGALSSAFEVKEAPADKLLAGEDVLVVAYDTYSGSTEAVEAALTANGATYLEVDEYTFQAMSVAELLEYQAVFFVGIPYGTSQTHLMEYMDAGGNMFVADNDVGWSQGATLFYTDYLQSSYNTDDGGSRILIGEDFMSALTLDILDDPYPDGFTVGAEGVEIFYFDGSGYAGGVAVDRNGYKAVYLSFDFYYLYDAGVAAELIGNVLGFLAPAEIPWLYEEPVTGTVGADSFFDVWVTFDSMTYTVGSELTAMLKVKTDDPMTATYEIPVMMTIVAPEYGVAISPDDSLTGEPGETVVYEVIVTNVGNGPMDSYDLTFTGNDWATALDVTTVGPLAGGESATVSVSVTVPDDVVLPDDDAVQVTATSQGDPAKTATTMLTTVAGGDFGVDLEPETSAASGEAGDVITYTLRLTNTGATADTITVSFAGAGAAWTALPVSSFDLAGGASADVIVVVTIPSDAEAGDYPITVTATSAHDPSASDEVEVTTTVIEVGYMIYLPVAFKIFIP